MIKVYETMGTTDSWMQNDSSPKLTIFRSRELSMKLAGVWFNRDKKKSVFPQRAVNFRNLSPKEVAEADNIMKFKEDLHKFSGQWVHDQY